MSDNNNDYGASRPAHRGQRNNPYQQQGGYPQQGGYQQAGDGYPQQGGYQQAGGYVPAGSASGQRRAAAHRRATNTQARAHAAQQPQGRAHLRQAPPQARRPQRRSPVPFIILIIALVVVGVCAFLFVSRCSKGDAQQPQQEQQQQGAPLTEDSGSVAQTEVAQGPHDVTINALMVGDMLVHHGVWESGEISMEERNYDHLFAHVLDDLNWADIAMIDQETPLAGGGTFAYTGFPTFNGPQEIADAEAKAGFNVILHASNHAMDQGSDGLRKELEYWRSHFPEVQVVGAYMPQQETAAEYGPIYYEKDGFKVAILNYTYDLNGYPDPYDAVCEINYDQIKRDVQIAESTADLTIVCPHWGTENETTPNSEQIDLAKAMADWGVDVIIGNHPHVIQPVSTVTSSSGQVVPVYWSTGNFISTMDTDANLIGGIAKVTLIKDASGNARVDAATFTPLVAHRAITVSSYGIDDESTEPSYNPDMTTYKLVDYTDSVASTNAWRPDDSRPSHAWCVDFCSSILGSGFDPTTCVFTLDLSGASSASGSSSASSSSNTGTTSGSTESGSSTSSSSGNSSALPAAA